MKIQDLKIEPVIISQRMPINGNTVTFDFGASPSDEEVEIITDLKEAQLIRKFLSPQSSASSTFLQAMGLDYPYCWVVFEQLTGQMLKGFPHTKPGDVDLICGNVNRKTGRPEFHHLVGCQVKIRKIKDNNSLMGFPSGRGTVQAEHTVLMGFDKTYLWHLVVREPRQVEEGYSPTWNVFNNGSFGSAFNVCKNSITDALNNSRTKWGYGVAGFGQAHGQQWEDCSSFWCEIVREAPLHPLKLDDNANRWRSEIILHLSKILKTSLIII